MDAAMLEAGMTGKFETDYAQAKAALFQLAFLRASDAANAGATLKFLANIVGNKPGPVLKSEREVFNARMDAWVAIRRLTERLENNSGTQSIDQLWVAADDAVKNWMRLAQ
jgi:hypothetical protein